MHRLGAWMVVALLLAGSAGAQPHGQCGTPVPTSADLQMLKALTAEEQKSLPHAITIPIAMHVITSGRTGKIPRQAIDLMVYNLNAVFHDQDISFYLYKLEYKNNKSWYKACGLGSANEAKMKKKLAVDPRHVLNVYSCIPGNIGNLTILGYAPFPWLFPESHYLHGVVLHPGVLPTGAGIPGYDYYGLTAAHEVGHYLGLLHTFQDGCDGDGDLVADTPAQLEASFQCSTAVDTCPQPGIDDLTNFMNYADDFCRNHFTLGQRDFISLVLPEFRPSLF